MQLLLLLFRCDLFLSPLSLPPSYTLFALRFMVMPLKSLHLLMSITRLVIDSLQNSRLFLPPQIPGSRPHCNRKNSREQEIEPYPPGHYLIMGLGMEVEEARAEERLTGR